MTCRGVMNVFYSVLLVKLGELWFTFRYTCKNVCSTNVLHLQVLCTKHILQTQLFLVVLCKDFFLQSFVV